MFKMKEQKAGEDNEKKNSKPEQNSGGKLAVIRVRGLVEVNRDITMTLNQLRLYNRNFCTVIPNNDSSRGMVKKVNDYVTWGEIDDGTFNLLVEKRGEAYKERTTDKKSILKYNKFLSHNGKNIKKYFRLNSPKKGYGRKGIKLPFTSGGALGYRAEKIKDLIERMI